MLKKAKLWNLICRTGYLLACWRNMLSSDPHKNCSTLNRLVVDISVGISRGNNYPVKIFVGNYLEFKLNL